MCDFTKNASTRAGPLNEATTTAWPAMLEIRYGHAATEVRDLLSQGFCPIECSFGVESVVDELRLDHHGELSTLEPVSLRAYRDHFGSCRHDPRFVVTGAADADAAFAIAALAGLLPTLESERGAVPLLELARTIAESDLNPFARRWEESDTGLLPLCYKQRMKTAKHDAAAFYAGVECWRDLISNPPNDLLATVRAEETARVAKARQATVLRLGPDVAFVECPAWGWDVWYAEIAPVIVAYLGEAHRCSIGCRDQATATRLFGPEGLLGVARALTPPGWGGRETIIGSPRGVALPRDGALHAAQQVAGSLSHRCASFGYSP